MCHDLRVRLLAELMAGSGFLLNSSKRKKSFVLNFCTVRVRGFVFSLSAKKNMVIAP